MNTWRCGDCGTRYPETVHRCSRRFDDYLSLRGGTVESAINRAVDKAIQPLVAQALRRLQPPKPQPLKIRWVTEFGKARTQPLSGLGPLAA